MYNFTSDASVFGVPYADFERAKREVIVSPANVTFFSTKPTKERVGVLRIVFVTLHGDVFRYSANYTDKNQYVNFTNEKVTGQVRNEEALAEHLGMGPIAFFEKQYGAKFFNTLLV